METPHTEKLSERLKFSKQEVVETWLQSIRDQISIASRTDRTHLIDNLPQFIEDVAKALRREDSNLTTKDSATWEEHAIRRAHQTDISLPDLIQEYQVLRSVVLETLWEEGPLSLEEVLLVNRSFENTITNSIRVFERERLAATNRELQLSSIFVKSVPGPFYILNRDWTYVYVNEKALEISGKLKKSDCLGKKIWDIYPKARNGKLVKKFKVAMEEKKQVQFEMYDKSSDHWYMIECYPNEIGIAVFYRDITDRVEAENRMAEQKSFLEAMIEQMPAGVMILEAETGQLVVTNKEMEQVFGQPVHINSWKDFEDIGGLHEDMTPYKLIEYPSVRALNGETVKDEEMPFRRKDGRLTHFLVSAAPIWNGKKEISHVVTVVTDIGELKKIQQELSRSNRDLSIYSATVAHDLKSPVNTMVSMTELLSLKNEEKFDEQSAELIHFIVTASKRMQRLIDNLLSYARINEETEPFKPVDLNHVLEDVKKNLKGPIEQSHAEIRCEKLPTLLGDEVQLTSLFQNLISNSIKFHSEEEPRIEIQFETKDNNYLIAVQDNGIGFKPEQGRHLFEPFIRLHGQAAYEGSGLGLAICKRIVERHQGKIWAHSNPGSGTIFFIEIPCCLEKK